LDRKLKDSGKALRQAVAATGTAVMDLHGLGPVGAARVLSDVADVTRFPTGRTSRPGTAPPLSMPPAASRSATACRGRGTGGSTACCTSWPSSSCATTPKAGPASGARSPRKDEDGGPAVPQTAAIRRGLPPARRRGQDSRPSPAGTRRPNGNGPGRTRGGGYEIQRGRPQPHDRLFG
jgi:hypothetical protein